jgi:hypothetical protein
MATYAAKVRETGVDNSTVRLDQDGRLSSNLAMQPFTSKTGQVGVFYVDGNITSSGDGKTWQTAKKTLTEGLALAQTYQSTSANRAWAHRATVYCCGDSFTEDLVILAEKTDVIGVGSADSLKKPQLIGNHVPITTNTWGCRFINWQFSEADAGAMWTLTAPSAGINFIDCDFSVRGAVATHGILMTALGYANVVIEGCYFDAYPSGFTTGAIVIGAGLGDKIVIRNNSINADKGVVIDSGYTNVAGTCLIDNNVIHTTGIGVDDDSDLAIVSRNMFISDADNDTIGNIVDSNVKLAVGNIVTGDSSTQTHPFAAIS